ncbi:MAG: winged helix-turn-helix domain-containing protein [Candidatus Methanomethylicaceae archaeon]
MEGEELREILDALSERTRYAILEAISRRPMTGDEIAVAVERSRSTVESHLSILLRLGLIARKKEDKRYFYEITPKAEAWLNREAPKVEMTRKYHKYEWWVYAPPLSLLYFFVNSFIVGFPLWLFALIFGVVSLPFCRSLRDLMFSVLISSLIISVMPSLFVFQPYSILDLFLSFLISLALLATISVPLWAGLRKILSYLELEIF